ncbi:MAG TPA: hypothetical protein VJT50_14320 [Pyrinomonadaceae bacterium]|nr:hypothetical protein [Pyrinomonadaceae bacterium]
MKRILTLCAVLAATGLALFISTPRTRAVTVCQPTGFFRDGINMTAALINPPSVTGTVNATGCNIGVYYGPGSTGQIKNAEIFGANYFGVVANGDTGGVALDILSSNIHDIGDSPHTGAQHGYGIYWRSFFPQGGVIGRIVGNTITAYQKGGMLINGSGVQANIFDNTVTGDGHVTFISQNGIQIGYGSTASVMRNSVSGNSYIGTDGSSAAGVLVVGGAFFGICPDGNDCPYTVNAKINDNVLLNNDVGVWLFNATSGGSAPATATNNKVVNNTISDDLCFNTAYQAGISDIGNNDKIINNTISGPGYVGCLTAFNPTGAKIDVDPTQGPKVHANK